MEGVLIFRPFDKGKITSNPSEEVRTELRHRLPRLTEETIRRLGEVETGESSGKVPETLRKRKSDEQDKVASNDRKKRQKNE